MSRRNTALGLSLILAILLGTLPVIVQAQGSVPPPTIIAFTADLESITVAHAEVGQTEAELSWHTTGVTADHLLLIDLYHLNGWSPLVDADDAPLAPSGSYPIQVNHPLNFGPPTYRLSIVDRQGQVLDERTISISYEAVSEDETASIDVFTADVSSVDAAALSGGTARINVAWEVIARPATANLVFEQVLSEANVVSVELPRPTLWIPSSGQGPVAPVMPPDGQVILLRLRLVDMVDGTVYAEQTLPLSVTGGMAGGVSVTALPGGAETHTLEPEIVSFTAVNPVTARDGEVLLTWETNGTDRVWIEQWLPDGRSSDRVYADLPPTGALTVPLQNRYAYGVRFVLWLGPAQNRVGGETVEVAIACPYTYFFDPIPETEETCPVAEAREVEAAFQTFQGGTMIWRGDTGDVFVLHVEGDWEVFQEEVWLTAGQEIPQESPPPGLFQPVSGFGQVWARAARYRMGWATAPEQGFTMRVQESATGWGHPWHFFFTWPDGRVVGLFRGSSWLYLP